MEAYQQLEYKFKIWKGCGEGRHTVACSSGTSALHLALETLRLPLGSTVLVPNYTMIACARAVTMAGLVPKFVDCHSEDLLMSEEAIEKASSLDVTAIMPVHIYGRRCNMPWISSYAADRGWKVVEDLAEAHGVPPSPFSHAACWSFYKNKIVSGEEGGMCAFKDGDVAEQARSLRCLGFTPEHNFMHVPRGMNARLSNANAKLISRSLTGVVGNLRRRARVAGWYDQYVDDKYFMPRRDVNWVYDVRLPGGNVGGRISERLRAAGIEARQGFKTMDLQPEYATGIIDWDSNAYQASLDIMYLPIYPYMTGDQVRVIAEKFNKLAK